MSTPKRTDRGRMRAMNSKLVLDTVLGAGTASQADLVRATKLSTGTVVHIVQDLRERGFLVEVGQGRSTGGRKPTMLEMNPRAALVLSCRVGPGRATAAVLDVRAATLSRRELAIEPDRGPASFMSSLAASLKEQLRALRLPARLVAGLGVSLHGPVDAERGVLLLSEHLGWTQVPFGPELERLLGVPVFVEAEARAIALAEQSWGAARGASDFVLVELDSGIGMVQVLDGRLCRGSHSLAGELGFTAWQMPSGGGPLSPRVLEELAALEVVSRRARAITGHGQPDASDDSQLRLLADAYRAGEPRARELLEEISAVVGLAVANVVNLLDPELVLLAGRLVSGSMGVLVDLVGARVRSHLVGAQAGLPRIESARLGEEAALLGAARPVIDRFLSVENLARGRPAGRGT